MKKVIALLVLSFACSFGAAKAATRTVDTVADNGALTACTAAANDCSLRGAISGAAANDTIEFSTDLNNQVITLTSNSEITIDKSLTVIGPGANLLTIDGGPSGNRIFYINAAASVVIRGLTIIGGNGTGAGNAALGGGLHGGAIFSSSSSLRLEKVALHSNSADYGGAVFSSRHLVIINSTFSQNYAQIRGGAIEQRGSGDSLFYVENSTVSGNQALNQGGGLFIFNGANLNSRLNFVTVTDNDANGTAGGGLYFTGNFLKISNSIIAGNRGLNVGNQANIAGQPYTDSGFNFVSGNPLLNPLDYYGGTTKTHSLQCGSPAINAADPNNANNPPDDQRGAAIRPIGGRSDIGAFETPNIVISNPAFLPDAPVNAPYSRTLTASCGTAPYNYAVESGALPNGMTLTAGGSLSGTPTQTGVFNFRISATDSLGASDARDFTLAIIAIAPTNLPVVSYNVPFSRQFTIPGSISTYVFSIESGTLPTGITLAPGGLLAGTTTQTGTFNFVVRATNNASGVFLTATYTLSADYYVMNTNNSGAGSLRQLINDTPAGGTVRFDPAFFAAPQTIALTGGEIVINKNLTITGADVNLPTIDAANQSRVINGQPAVTLTISHLRITRGNAGASNNGGCVLVAGVFNFSDGEISNCSANGGGAIYSVSTGTINLLRSIVKSSQASSGGGIYASGALFLTDSIVENNGAGGGGGIAFVPSAGQTANITRSIVRLNTAGNSGGIFNFGTLNFTDSSLNNNTSAFAGGLTNEGFANIVNSTVSGNRATSNKGAGIYNSSSKVTHLLNTTITNNQADTTAGAGIWNENFSNPMITVRARNSIIAANISGAGNPVDYVGDIVNLGNNLINNANPGLAPLGNYGGATPTHALLQNSPAANAGDNCAITANSCGIAHPAVSNDQRGTNTPRKIGANVDIGAFERNVLFDQSSLPNGTKNAAYSQNLTAMRATNFAENLLSSEKNDLFDANNLLAPFTFSIITISGQSLPNGLTLASDGTISGTPTTVGTSTFTVKATDADGIAGVSQYTITTVNSPPTISGATISRQAGSSASNSTIAAVGDLQSGANGVSVAVTTASPSNGVTVSNVVNTNGNITANVIAVCGATNATFTLRATDGDGATATSILTVNVSANTAPTLQYPTSASVSFNGSQNVTPTTASDNGTMTFSILSVSPVLTTAPTVDANGVVSITNAQPLGNHVITVRATDNCGLTTDASFTLNVVPPLKTVTKIEDTNDGVCDADCSLREAIATAVSGDTVLFAAPLFDTAQTITLGSELSVSGKTISVTGRAINLTTLSGNNQNRIFNVANNGNLTLNNLTITNGSDAANGGGVYNAGTLQINNCAISNNAINGSGESRGGGLYNHDFATTTVTGSTISGNSVTGNDTAGGGLYNGSFSTLTITNSTISGNTVSGSGNFVNVGGGIANSNGILTVKNSTVSGNTANGGTNNRGGGIHSQYRTLTLIGVTITGNIAGVSGFSYGGGFFSSQDDVILANSIVSGNSAPSNPNIFGSLNPSNFNLIDGDARLAPLGFYGGNTKTHALLPDSPALNGGNPAYNADTHGITDQRGSSRVIGNRIDIGAFESNIVFNQTSLPNANTSVNYSQQLSANRQTNYAELENLAPSVFEVVPVAGQSLPPGITLSTGGLLSGTPTAARNYVFTVKATDTDGIAGASQYTIQVFTPSAANVSISGRVITANNSGVRNVIVTLTGGNGTTRTTRTGAFGNYRFEEVEAGETYIITAISKRFTFDQPSQVLTVNEDVAEVNFVVRE